MTHSHSRPDRGMSRRLFAVALASAITLTPALARSNPDLGADEAAFVDRVNAYFNRFVFLQGSFTQINPDGQVAEGDFYMRRPGRVRFDFKPPSRLLVVADGFWIGIIDKRLNTTDRYPIASTPYWALLKEEVDLRRDANIISVETEPGVALLTIADPSGEAPGEVTLIFDTQDTLALKQWLITDAQGLTTSVALNDVVENRQVRNDMFVIRDNYN